jgi:cytochrome c oxidase subunit 2
MRVDLYERIWMWAAGALILFFLAAIGVGAGLQAIQPPSHLETLDPTTIATHPEFGNPGVNVMPDGRIVVSVVTQMFSFSPDPIEVPAGRPITFRVTSSDVLHGFQIAGTNANTMAVPGYVSQFTVTFAQPGEHLIACNEYCGAFHHGMVGKLIVKRERP